MNKDFRVREANMQEKIKGYKEVSLSKNEEEKKEVKEKQNIEPKGNFIDYYEIFRPRTTGKFYEKYASS